MAPQSETWVASGRPQKLRTRAVSSHGCAQLGTPLMLVYEHMVPTERPAMRPAAYGGRSVSMRSKFVLQCTSDVRTVSSA